MAAPVDNFSRPRHEPATLDGMGRRREPLTGALRALSDRMHALAATRGGVVNAKQAHALGADDSAIRRLCRSGEWSRIRRGVYADARFEPRERSGHLRRCAAVLAGLHEDAVVSHLSAARLLGARPVVERADAGGRSWFESSSRWWLLEAGLPRPELQVCFLDQLGEIRAQVDMWFAAMRTVGEADGAGKYDKPGSLFAEKQREDWLRDSHRVEVVRWIPREMRTGEGRAEVAARFERAFRRAG